jgi:hypothetical protein
MELYFPGQDQNFQEVPFQEQVLEHVCSPVKNQFLKEKSFSFIETNLYILLLWRLTLYDASTIKC